MIKLYPERVTERSILHEKIPINCSLGSAYHGCADRLRRTDQHARSEERRVGKECRL